MIKNLFFFCSVKSHYNNVALLLFRVMVSGALIYGHGYGKFMRLLDGNVWGRTHLFFSEEVTFAMITFAEFFCSIFIIFGQSFKWPPLLQEIKFLIENWSV